MLNPEIDTVCADTVEPQVQGRLDGERRNPVPWSFRSLARLLDDDCLTKKAYLNAVAAALDYTARLAVGFLINPLLVTGLGDYKYGAWQILDRLMGYIAPASGRPTQTLKWTIAYHQTSFDYDAKRRQVGSALVVWLLFLPILLALGTLLVWLVPTWLKTPPNYSRAVHVAAALLLADMVLGNLADMPRSVLEGENLGYKRMGLSAGLTIAGGGLTALALYFKAGLIGVATANLATTLLTGAFFLQVVRAYSSWFGIARPSYEEVRRFLKLSGWFLGWRLVFQLMIASDVVVLGMIGSVKQVTTYTLTRYVPETTISLVAIIVFGITPGLGGIIGSGNLSKAVELRKEIMSVTWLILTVVGTTTLLFNGFFIRLWVGKQHYAGLTGTFLVMVMAIQFVLIRNDANIIDLTLDLRSKVLIGALSAVLSLVLAVILVGPLKWGIVGLCLGFIGGRLLLSLTYPWLVGRSLGVTMMAQLREALRPSAVTISLFALVVSLGRFLTVRTWVGLVLSVGTAVIPIFLLALYLGLSRERRQQFWSRMTALRPRPLEAKEEAVSAAGRDEE